MKIPLKTLVLVRHGESLANVADNDSKRGDDKHYTDKFRAMHTSEVNLSERGIKQAKVAKKWIEKELSDIQFDFGLTSHYRRALETASLAKPESLKLIIQEQRLAERNWGALDMLPYSEQIKKYPKVFEEKHKDELNWLPHLGESMAQKCLVILDFLDDVSRVHEGEHGFLATHGEAMLCIRKEIEGWNEEEFIKILHSRDPMDKIHNGHIYQYSSQNPQSKEWGTQLKWFRSVCPNDTSLSTNLWQKIAS